MIVYYSIYFKYAAFAVALIALPFIALIALKIFQKLTVGRVRSLVCLKGKVAIITGGSSGVGFETALALASRGCKVIIADRRDASKAKQKIIELTQNDEIESKILDLSSLQSVRRFAKEINETEKRLDILIHNANVGHVTNKHSDDNLHITMQINHFGPFLLTHLLADLLKKSAPSRVIFVSSALAYCSNLTKENLNYSKDHSLSIFRTSLIQANSKLAQIIASNGFAERFKDVGVTSNSLHPGLVNTEMFKLAIKYRGISTIAAVLRYIVLLAYGKSAEEGAQTTIHLALSRQLKDVTGKHFWDCRPFPMPPLAWNKKLTDEIWQQSEILVGLKPEEKL